MALNLYYQFIVIQILYFGPTLLYCDGIFHLKFTNTQLICHLCHLPEKCKYCFIGTFFTIFENIPIKPTKFPFQRSITQCQVVYRVRQVNLYTFKTACHFSCINTTESRVIRRWKGNFVGFLGFFSKIVKNVLMKRYLHFSGKWQK